MTTPDYNTLIHEWSRLETDRKQIVEAQDAIKAALRDLPAKKHTFDAGTITISINRTINPAAFAERYPIHEYPQFYTAKPDSTKIRDALAPAEIAELSTEGQPRVTIK